MHKSPEPSESNALSKDTVSLSMGEYKTVTANEKLLEARKRASIPPIFKRIIINPEWKVVRVFEALIVIFALLSTLVSAWFANFGAPDDKYGLGFDIFMECCFGIDIIKNFLMMYQDPCDPRKYIKDVRKIMKRYLKGAFFFDLLALMAGPLYYVLVNFSGSDDMAQLIFLLRLFRCPKMRILIDLDKFT